MPLDPTLPFASESAATRLEPNYESAFTAYRATPTPQTRGALLSAVAPVLDTAVRSYGGAGASPTLRSQAKRDAIRAFDSYDPAKGNLKTHLLSQLRSLQRHAVQQQQIISLPEQVRLDRQRLDATERELEEQLGRPPSSQQLADHLGLSLKRIAYIRQARPAVSHGSVLSDTDADDGPAELPASQVPGQNATANAWAELVYADLGDTDRVIYDRLLGRHGHRPTPPARVASLLGVSQSAVSQRAAKIQQMLDSRFGEELFR